jgi:hypothetical protein
MFSVVTTDSLDVGLKLVGTFSVAYPLDGLFVFQKYVLVSVPQLSLPSHYWIAFLSIPV